jgi:hypothetical protein
MIGRETSESTTRLSFAAFGLTVAGLVALSSATHATVFSREQDVSELRLGQRVKIDDGSCPAGQIKELSGATMSNAGVVRARKCVPRVGPKTK